MIAMYAKPVTHVAHLHAYNNVVSQHMSNEAGHMYTLVLKHVGLA